MSNAVANGNVAPPARAIPTGLGNPDKRPASIPVRLVILSKPQDIPGESAASKVKCDPSQPNRRHWACNFIPSLRHFEVFYLPSDPRDPILVGYIHEEKADSWYPV